MQVVQIKELLKRYKETTALHFFNLSVNEGEILGLLGPNGCGKTTAIHCTLGLLTFNQGTIEVFGQSLTPANNALKRQIGIVPQELAYLDRLTVYENIDFFCGLYVADKHQRKQYVEDAIRFVRLEDYRNFYPKKLSGGLKRRLNIACGIAHKPRLIFLDEPTVAVDTQSRQFILDGIKQLNAAGSTIVYTTHYLDEADYLCDRIVIMDKGEHIVSGSSAELKNMVTVKEKIHLELVAPASEALQQALQALPHLTLIDWQKDHAVLQFDHAGNHIVDVALALQANDTAYLNMYSEQPSLNDVFLAFTGKDLRD